MLKNFFRVFIIIIFSFNILNANNKKTSLDATLSVISSISDIISALQLERGFSSVYIASKGTMFENNLKKSYKNSDKKIEKLHKQFQENAKLLDTYFTKNDRENLHKYLHKNLKVLRKDVLNVKLTFLQEFNKYSQIISYLLLQISNISDKIENEELKNKLYIYYTFLMYKESIGQKRAELGVLFTLKKFNKDIYEKFLTSNTQEKIYLKVFLHNADKQTKELFYKISKSRVFKTIKTYENIALEQFSNKKVSADAKDWFDNATEKLKLLTTIQNKIFDEVLSIAYKIKTHSLILLNKKERKWLENNPIIKIAVMNYWPKDATGNSIHTHLLKLLNKYGNINLFPVYYNRWKDGFEDAKKGDGIYGIMNLSFSKEREKYFFYSKPYYFSPNYLIVRSDNNDIKSLNDLKNKKVLLKDKSITHKIVKNLNVKVIDIPTDKEIYKRLANDKTIDAGIVYIKNDELLKKYKLKVVNIISTKYNNSYIGINKKYPYLASIIDKIFNVIPKKEIKKIQEIKYNVNKKGELIFTAKEKEWLNKHIPLKYVYDPNWPPFEWKNEVGQHTGIIADILQIISKKTGIKFVPINTNVWSESVKLMKEKKADMYSAVVKTKERLSYLKFTNHNIYSIPGVVIAKRDDKTLYLDVKNALKDKKVGIVKNYSISKYMQNHYNLNYDIVSSVNEGFEKLENNKIDVLILNLATSKYIISHNRYNDLVIKMKVPFTLNLKIAIQKDMPDVIISILDKALGSISKKEYNDIYYKWTNVETIEKINWKIVYEIVIVFVVLILIALWWIKKQNRIKRIIEESEKKMRSIIENSQDAIVVIDENAYITLWNNAAEKIFGWRGDEVLGKTINIIVPEKYRKGHIAKIKQATKIGKTKIFNGNTVEIEAINKKRETFPIELSISSYKIDNKTYFSANIRDISERVKLLNEIKEKTKFTEAVLNSQSSFVITTDGENLNSANKAFLKFFDVKNVEEFKQKYNKCICDFFDEKSSDEYIKKEINKENWLEYIYNRPNTTHKVIIKFNNKKYIFTISIDKILYNDNILYVVVLNNITELELAKKEIETLHKNMKDSIEYASLIQRAIMPNEEELKPFFKDYFVSWKPKDIVGGDIWLFNSLNENECLLFVIDCTGHGVPGAFVTMIVKTIESKLITKLKEHTELDISPGIIMSYFNKTMKILLKQEDKSSISNAGFDGGIIYYNKQKKILKYCGANTPLFYVENGEVNVIKGNRYSVGYKSCDINYEYKENILEVNEEMKFFITTDGFLDQIGGKKNIPFGKKRFKNIILNNYHKKLSEIQRILFLELEKWKKDNEQNDDITVIGFEI